MCAQLGCRARATGVCGRALRVLAVSCAKLICVPPVTCLPRRAARVRARSCVLRVHLCDVWIADRTRARRVRGVRACVGSLCVSDTRPRR